MQRPFQSFHGCLVVALALVGNMVKDAHDRAVDVCQLFPQFEFWPTFHDELLLHHTRLPLVPTPVSTILVIAALLLAVALTYFRLVELFWLFLVDLVSGRSIYNLLFVHIPAWIPFFAAEPSVPELLSDPEEVEGLEGNGTTTVACSAAMAKLVQVKMQHENRTLERPDHWLVFDPDEDELVPKKDFDAKRLQRALGSRSSTESSSTASTASPVTSPTKKLRPVELDELRNR